MVFNNKRNGILLAILCGLLAYLFNYGYIEEYVVNALAYIPYDIISGAIIGNLLDYSLPLFQVFGLIICLLTNQSSFILFYAPVILVAYIFILFEIFSKISHNYLLSAALVGLFIVMPRDLRYAGLVGHGVGILLFYLIFYVLILAFCKKMTNRQCVLLLIPTIVALNYFSYNYIAIIGLCVSCMLFLAFYQRLPINIIKQRHSQHIHCDKIPIKMIGTIFSLIFCLIFGLNSFWSHNYISFASTTIGDESLISYITNLVTSFIAKYIHIIVDIGGEYAQSTSLFGAFIYQSNPILLSLNTVKIICVFISILFALILCIRSIFNPAHQVFSSNSSGFRYLIYSLLGGFILFFIVRLTAGQIILDILLIPSIIYLLYVSGNILVNTRLNKLFKVGSLLLLIVIILTTFGGILIEENEEINVPILDNFPSINTYSMWYYQYGNSISLYSDVLTSGLINYFIVENTEEYIESLRSHVHIFAKISDTFLSLLLKENVVVGHNYLLINEKLNTYAISDTEWITINAEYINGNNLRYQSSINKVYSNPSMSSYIGVY